MASGVTCLLGDILGCLLVFLCYLRLGLLVKRRIFIYWAVAFGVALLIKARSLLLLEIATYSNNVVNFFLYCVFTLLIAGGLVSYFQEDLSALKWPLVIGLALSLVLYAVLIDFYYLKVWGFIICTYLLCMCYSSYLKQTESWLYGSAGYFLLVLGVIQAKLSLGYDNKIMPGAALASVFMSTTMVSHLLIENLKSTKESLVQRKMQLQMATDLGCVGPVEWQYPQGKFKAILKFFNGDEYSAQAIDTLTEFTDRLQPADRAAFMDLMQGSAIKEADYTTLELKLNSLQHSAQWFRLDVQPVGRVKSSVRVAGFLRNIQVQKDKVQTQNISQVIIDHAPHSTCLLKADMRFYFVNETMCQLYGYSRAEFSHLTLKDIDPHISDGLWSSYLQELEDKEQIEIEAGHLTKDGKIIEQVLTVFPLPLDNEIYYCVYASPRAERNKIRSEFAEQVALNTALLENAPIGVSLKSVRNGFRYCLWNKAMSSLTGVSAQEAIGKNDQELFSPEIAKRCQQVDLKVMTSKSKLKFKYKHFNKRKQERIILSNNFPIFNQAREVMFILVLCTDVTEEEIKKYQITQSERMQIVSQLARGISHDFNNHLTGALGYATLLKSKLTDPTLLRYVDNIIVSSQLAATLTNQLCIFSRKHTASFEQINIYEIIDKSVELFKHMLRQNIELQVNSHSHQIPVKGDKVQIQNLLLILFINARDAMAQGGTLSITTKQVSEVPSNVMYNFTSKEAAPFLYLGIRDTGTGMPADILPHIFEPFFTTKAPCRGTGMGLAVLYGSIKAHNGAINVWSKVGEGTLFELYLPLIENHQLQPLAEPDLIALPVKGYILLADDEGIVRSYLSNVLKQYGYGVRACSNGKEAVAIFKENPQKFGLVILDVKMPEMGGKEAFYCLKYENPSVRVIMITGQVLEREIIDLQLEGIDTILQKPIRLNVLMSHVTRIFEEQKTG